MKKFFSLIAAAIVVSFASCGVNTTSNTAEEDSLFIDTVAVLDQTQTLESVASALTQKLENGDAAGIQAVVAEVAEQVKDLVAAGDNTAAAEYASKIKDFVETNKAKIEEIAGAGSSVVNEIINAVQALPANAGDAANEAVDEMKADAKATADSVKTVAEDAVKEAVESAKTQVNEKIDEAATKATDAANKAVNEAADKAKKALGL